MTWKATKILLKVYRFSIVNDPVTKLSSYTSKVGKKSINSTEVTNFSYSEVLGRYHICITQDFTSHDTISYTSKPLYQLLFVHLIRGSESSVNTCVANKSKDNLKPQVYACSRACLHTGIGTETRDSTVVCVTNIVYQKNSYRTSIFFLAK